VTDTPATTDGGAAATLDAHPLVVLLRGSYPYAVMHAETAADGMLTVTIRRDAIAAACHLLRDHPEARFELCSDVVGVDMLGQEPRFCVVYHLASLAHNAWLRLKVGVPSHDAVLPSVTEVWSGANYPEREIFDLFGIRFTGHPNLTRILMPDDWEGYPLRKDYPMSGKTPWTPTY